jgi:hypothetical protein
MGQLNGQFIYIKYLLWICRKGSTGMGRKREAVYYSSRISKGLQGPRTFNTNV